MFHKNNSTRRPQRQFDTYDEFNERIRRAERAECRKVTDPPRRPVTHGFREEPGRTDRSGSSYTVWGISAQAFLEGKPYHAATYTTAPTERAARYAAHEAALGLFPKADGWERHGEAIVRIDPMYFEL